MIPVAFALFLFCFYCLPTRTSMPYIWVSIHARDHFPMFFCCYSGHLIWNGSFYLEMLIWWAAFLGVAATIEWLSRRNDPEWGGPFAGFGRLSSMGPAILVLHLLFLLLTLYCLFSKHPVYGPISAGITALLTLVGGSYLSERFE